MSYNPKKYCSNKGGSKILFIACPLRLLLCCVALLSMSCFTFAQNKTSKTITVRVSDIENRLVSGVDLKIYISKKTIEGITDSNGLFNYQTADCDSLTTATVSIRSILYTPIDTVVDFSRSVELQLILKPIALDGVKIIGYNKKSKINAEKVIFKIDTDGLLKYAKANMALRRIPNVVYSDSKGTFTLMGNRKSAKVLVDGIETSHEELLKIEASDIDRVELRYVGFNDDNCSGEINVILIKNLPRLYKGDINIGSQLLNKGFSGGHSFTIRSNIIDCSTWFYYYNNRQKTGHEIDRDNSNVYSSERGVHVQQYSAGCKAKIFLSNKWNTVFSFYTFGFMGPATVSRKLNGNMQPQQKSDESFYNNTTNLVIKHNINSHERLFIKSRFFNYKSTNSTSPPTSDYTGRMNELSGNFVYEADSIAAFSKFHNFAAGYKGIYRASVLISSDKYYNSSVHQLYIKDNLTLSDNLDLFVLLRGELDGYRFENERPIRRSAFLPSASLQYETAGGSLCATYLRSIERPNVDYLNPDILYLNEFSKVKGNPYLGSQYTDKITLRYDRQIKDNSFTATASFESIKNIIDNIHINDYNLSTYENIGKGKIVELNISYNKPLFSNALNLNLGVGGGHAVYKIDPQYSSISLSRGNIGWYFKSSANISFLMPKEWFVNVSMNYTSKDILPDATLYKKPAIDVIVTKSLLKNNLELSLQYYDIFRLSGDWRTKRRFKGINQVETRRMQSLLLFSLEYRFGRRFKSRTVGNDIENDDIKTKK